VKEIGRIAREEEQENAGRNKEEEGKEKVSRDKKTVYESVKTVIVTNLGKKTQIVIAVVT
jgi:putative Ca2+/H+ antiporter (TMEM165/GDT1 family)